MVSVKDISGGLKRGPNLGPPERSISVTSQKLLLSAKFSVDLKTYACCSRYVLCASRALQFRVCINVSMWISNR